jgi:hypothetical protein
MFGSCANDLKEDETRIAGTYLVLVFLVIFLGGLDNFHGFLRKITNGINHCFSSSMLGSLYCGKERWINAAEEAENESYQKVDNVIRQRFVECICFSKDLEQRGDDQCQGRNHGFCDILKNPSKATFDRLFGHRDGSCNGKNDASEEKKDLLFELR